MILTIYLIIALIFLVLGYKYKDYDTFYGVGEFCLLWPILIFVLFTRVANNWIEREINKL